jgi:hypothetical protein
MIPDTALQTNRASAQTNDFERLSFSIGFFACEIFYGDHHGVCNMAGALLGVLLAIDFRDLRPRS